MNAPNTSYKTGILESQTEHLHYLERQQRNLLTLAHQLNSYQCVPKTVLLHDQMEGLRETLRKLMKENETLIRKIRASGESAQQHFDECKAQFLKMLQLERNVLTYIGKARIHR